MPKGFYEHVKGRHWKVSNTSKISEAMKKRWKNPEYRLKQKNNPGTTGKHWKIKDTSKMKGVQNTLGKHWKVKDSSNIKEAQNKPETRRKKREWNINNPNKKFSNTKIERKIAEELTKKGIHYQQNIGLNNIANVDFYLPKYKIVIECDGCYYHNCLIHFPNSHKENRERDERKTNLLKSNGFSVYRFWGHEIDCSSEKCINKMILNKNRST